MKGGAEKLHMVNTKNYTTTVYCFPVNSILRAINQTTVDYFSLDVEGSEPYVLKGIDFDKIKIKVFRIEHNVCGLNTLIEILKPVGFELVKKVGVDAIFVHKSWRYGSAK